MGTLQLEGGKVTALQGHVLGTYPADLENLDNLSLKRACFQVTRPSPGPRQDQRVTRQSDLYSLRGAWGRLYLTLTKAALALAFQGLCVRGQAESGSETPAHSRSLGATHSHAGSGPRGQSPGLGARMWLHHCSEILSKPCLLPTFQSLRLWDGRRWGTQCFQVRSKDP